ncbi:MAG TPA: hypothetical protein VK525_07885 [Candidatus Saccharimonadales bacterium]|nr:hypothetical protein [Candidatus Saccharimonadales bacterium]
MASAFVSEYITKQQAHFLDRAASLTPDQKSAMKHFFREDLLESVRTLTLSGERIENPGFYTMLRMFGFKNLPDFAQMAAVTFHQVIVSHQPLSSELLFHELVHVEQYRQLGTVRSFANLYVQGFLAGGGYDAIPLEVNAYSLGARFESDSGSPFSVESEVSSFLARRNN